MAVQDAEMLDFFDLANALFGGGRPPIPATASWDMRWEGATRRYRAENLNDRFVGKFVDTASVTIDWSASNSDGYSFVSDPGSSETVFGLLGQERNGRFFPK